MWQITQHHGQGGLVEILDVVRSNPDANRATPVGDLRQLGCQVIKNVLCMGGVVVRDVEQAQRWRGGITRQRHVGAQLRQHQASGHRPLRMGGVAVRK